MEDELNAIVAKYQSRELEELSKRLAKIETKLVKQHRKRRRPTISFDLDTNYSKELDAIVTRCHLNSRSDLMRLIVKEWFCFHKDDQFLDIIASDVNEIDFR